MNQGIPKPLREALARQAVGDVHPSPDVLTLFLERTLAPVESEVVTHHLAQCAECREIVFLASDAIEDEVRDERELVAAASPVAAMPVYAATSRATAARADTSRPRWTIRMRWAMSIAAAAVLVSAGLVLQFYRAGSSHNAAPITVASKRPAPASPEAQPTMTAPDSLQALAKPPAPEMLAKAAPPRATARTGRAPGQTTVARNSADESSSAPAIEAAPRATASPATAGTVGGVSNVLVPEVRPQSAFAENEATQPLELKKSAPVLFGKPRMGMQSVRGVRPQWRIGPEGHLERSVAEDQWSRVLDQQPTTFHAVAVVGGEVWAGGNGGALFHSSDSGEHWSRVSLAANSKVETGAIVSIRFDDPQHGIVASDRGTRWVTTDGGVTWTTH